MSCPPTPEQEQAALREGPAMSSPKTAHPLARHVRVLVGFHVGGLAGATLGAVLMLIVAVPTGVSDLYAMAVAAPFYVVPLGVLGVWAGVIAGWKIGR